MYDVHCHMLPAFDDGAQNLETALEMARIAVDDGITHLACTPHIYPGLFDYDTSRIQSAVDDFKSELVKENISLTIGMGADIQLVSEMVQRLRDGSMPTINKSLYLLFEPPHHIAPSGFSEAVHNVITAGYVPVITHPERLSWIETHYQEFISVAAQGAWMQITAGSLNGRFGERPQHWAEKMLNDGIVHILATDAHNLTTRAPLLSEGRLAASKLVGEQEADALVNERPMAIWNNLPVKEVSQPPAFDENGEFIIQSKKRPGLLARLFKH